MNTDTLQSGETGLVRTMASENKYGKNKDGTYRKKNKGGRIIALEVQMLVCVSVCLSVTLATTVLKLKTLKFLVLKDFWMTSG